MTKAQRSAASRAPVPNTPRRRLLVSTAATTMACSVVGWPLAQTRGRRVAFVVGNARYSSEAPLRNPHNDARLIAELLRRELRFDEVVERRDLARRDLYDLIAEIGRKARGADAVVVYFSGHGMRGPGGNYLIPVDARITAEEHVKSEAVPAADVVDALQAGNPRVALLVLDACRDNPYSRRTKTLAKGLARMNVSGGNLLVAYATADGTVAEDGSGDHSPYAIALERHLRDTSRPMLAQFDSIRRTTRDATQNRQNPTREGDLETDVFLLGAPIQVAAVPVPVPAPAPMPAPSPAPAPAPTPLDLLVVRIGHVAPTSGVIAHLGLDNERGALIAVEELNQNPMVVGGRAVRFELVTADDAADPRQGLQAARRMVDEGVVAVVGHLNSGTSIPASKVYSEAGIAQISPSATNPRFTRQGYRTTFRMVIDDSSLGQLLGHHAVTERRARRIALVDDRTAYGQGIADEFEKGVKSAGGMVVGREFTNDKATDFSAILMSLSPKQPDLIFFGGMDTGVGPFIRQMQAMGLTATVMGGDGICSGELPKLAGGAINSVPVICAEAGGVPTPRRARMDSFLAQFKRRFGMDVQVYAPYTYDAIHIIAAAIRRSGQVSRAAVLGAMPQTNHDGVTGLIRFDSKGDVVAGAATLYTYRSGRREPTNVLLGRS